MLCMPSLVSSAGTSKDVAWWLWTSLTWVPVLIFCTFFVPQKVSESVYIWFAVQLLVIPVAIVARNKAKTDKTGSSTTKKQLTAVCMKIAWMASCPVLPCLLFVPLLHLTLVPQIDRLYNSCHENASDSCQHDYTNICKQTNVWYKFPWPSTVDGTFSSSPVSDCLKMLRLALEVSWILPVALSILRPGPIIKQCFTTKAVLTLYTLVMALEAMSLEIYILNDNIAYRWEKYPLATVIPIGLILLNTELLQHVGTFSVYLLKLKVDENSKEIKPLQVYQSWNCCIGAAIEFTFLVTRAALTVQRISDKTVTVNFTVFDWWIIKDALMLFFLVGLVISSRVRSSVTKISNDESNFLV